MSSLPDPSSLPLPSLVLMGFNESGLLGGGWHDLERDGRHGVPYRATQREATLRLGVPEGARSLFVLFSGSPTLLGRPLAGEIEVSAADAVPGPAGGRPPSRRLGVELAEDLWVVREIPLEGIAAPSLHVVFRMHDLVVPDRVLRNGDIRGLGYSVSAVWCR